MVITKWQWTWPEFRERYPIPEPVRCAVHVRAHGCCEDCGRALPLELHHLTYQFSTGHGPDDPYIFGHETVNDLLALCRDCHRHKHIGPDDSFYQDPEECKAEWDYYHHIMDKD